MSDTAVLTASAPGEAGRGPRLLDRVRDVIRLKHYSIRTEQAYVLWIRRFILFHGKRHPLELGEVEVSEFLTHLARDGNVAVSTQNQALNAILFLYRAVLEHPFGELANFERPSRPAKLPVVLTRGEVQAILRTLRGEKRLMASLLYGSGLRLLECLRLRVKDIELERREILVRDGKGMKDRVTTLPESLCEALRAHLLGVKKLHEQELREGFGAVFLEDGYDIRTVQELLGHADVSTTMIYTHVLDRRLPPAGNMVRSAPGTNLPATRVWEPYVDWVRSASR